MILRALGLAAGLLASAAIFTGSAQAQSATPAPPPAETAAKPTTTAAQKPPVPDNLKLAILIQTSVVALSQANLTGNFSVLHALAAPSFQQANPPQKLAQIFAGLRSKNLDLTPVILFSPILTKPASIDDNNRLHATGFYKTQPMQVRFDLMFEPVQGAWRLFGIALDAVPAPVESAAVTPPDTAKPASPDAAPQPATVPAAAAAKPAKVAKKKAKPGQPADATAAGAAPAADATTPAPAQ